MVHERHAEPLEEAVEPFVGLTFSQLPSNLRPRLEMVRPAWDKAGQDDDWREKRMDLARIAATNELPGPTKRGEDWFRDSADSVPDHAVDAGQSKGAHGLSAEAAEWIIGWCDATLSANHWFSLNDVEPGQAAMVMCHFNPNKETPEQAKQVTTDATGPNTTDAMGPKDFVQLLQRFEDLAKCKPQHRTLLQWLEFALASKLRYHPWIDQYVEAARLTVDDPAAGEMVLHAGQSLETPKEKRARLLEWHEEEEARGKRGALARVFAREMVGRPTADRANVGRDIKRARAERAEERRAGALFRPLGEQG